MIRVVVDTNIAGGKKGRPLENNDMRRLLDETRRENLQLVLAELVRKESANLWAEHLDDQGKAYGSARVTLQQAGVLGEAPAIEVERSAQRAAEEQRLRALVEEAGGLIAPLPALSHEEVVERALLRRQPFDTQGRNGYRDVLLWETVVELAADSPDTIILIARDKAAFFYKDPAQGLAPRLVDELRERLGRPDAVKAFFEFDEGIEEALRLSAEHAAEEQKAALAAQETASKDALANLNRLIAQDPGFAELLADAVDSALEYWDLGPDLRAFGIPDSDVYGAQLEVMSSVENLSFISAHVAEDGQVLAELSADVHGTADASMHPSTATLLDYDPRVRVYEFGYGGATASAEIDVGVRVVLDVVVDPENAMLGSLATVSQFEPLDT
jgi:hypothetical protein